MVNVPRMSRLQVLVYATTLTRFSPASVLGFFILWSGVTPAHHAAPQPGLDSGGQSPDLANSPPGPSMPGRKPEPVGIATLAVPDRVAFLFCP
jgi:hypothetical protein